MVKNDSNHFYYEFIEDSHPKVIKNNIHLDYTEDLERMVPKDLFKMGAIFSKKIYNFKFSKLAYRDT